MCVCVSSVLYRLVSMFVCPDSSEAQITQDALTSRLSESHVKAYVESSESPESSDLEKAKKAEYV